MALGSHQVLGPEFDFEEEEDVFEVFVGFDVIYIVEGGELEVVHFVEVFLYYVLLPDLDYLRVEVLRFLDLPFFLEELSHVVVAPAQKDAFRSMLLTLEINTLS